ncbi:LD-carboxypeptidase [Desulfovibrio sp. OttesenSCG-928-F20]|nr:LD-carboxypeptidase [Desulfovibrio sp. OttesenSCG-928-M16]MDL2290622.1 LD-carboxypeptidase [Desulfovibrio sp. OttesenSCG-928-F20]
MRIYCRLIVVFLLLFALDLVGGCAPKKPAPDRALPNLLNDALFIADLDKAGGSGRAGIVVVAPGSGFAGEDRDLAYALAHKAGLLFPEKAVDAGRVPYTANNDEQRLHLLADALTRPDIDIIWAMRGGYGSSRLLEDLAALKLDPERKKILVGYSDITFLHLFLHKLGWQSVHGSMLWEMTHPDKDENNFRLLAALLSGRLPELRYEGLRPANKAAREQASPIQGPLIGGNLTCLTATAGTPWAPEGEGAILFLEDVNEPGYKIDRMLIQLRQIGLLGKARAVLLGSFTRGDKDSTFALQRFADNCPIPVFTSDLFGHGAKNYPLVLNAPAVIDRNVADNFALRIDLRHFFSQKYNMN